MPQGRIRVCHVPKTIDNDLPLPGETPTFGFETARQLGSDSRAKLNGRLAHYRPLVFRRRNGPYSGSSRPRHRQVDGRHRDDHSGRVSRTDRVWKPCATFSKARCLNEQPYGIVQMESP